MKKILFFLLLCAIFVTTGCSNKPVIGFSDSPFTNDSAFTPKDTFKKGKKFYYFVYNPKGFETKLVKLQIFSRGDFEKTEFGGYNYLFNKTIELKNKKYFTDNYTINKKGQYIFQVFEFTNLQKPIALGIIRIED